MLNGVELEVKSKAKRSRMMGNNCSLSVHPSTGAHLFKDFVTIIQEIAHESPDAEHFSSTGG